MTSALATSQDQANDFEPEHVLIIRERLGTDYWYLFSEEWAGGIVTKNRPDVSRLWDDLEEAYGRFRDFPGLQNVYETWATLDASALQETFPPSTRSALEGLAAQAVGALRAYRDALKGAVQRRLTKTAVNPYAVTAYDFSALIEAVRRLRADRENLSDAVTTMCGLDGGNHPTIEGLWAEAEVSYLDYQRRIETSCPRLASPEVPSEEPTLPTEPPPGEITEIVAEVRSICERFQSVRDGLVSAVDAGLALSVYDYDPNWSHPGSPVVFECETPDTSRLL